MKILVTGCAGFIGSNLTDRLIKDGYNVVGIDNFYDYYDLKLKESNLENALTFDSFHLYREDILNFEKLEQIFRKEKVEKVIHLAARAGVRPSIDDPLLYTRVNVTGTVNMLKVSSKNNVEQFIFGSSSSVYGNSPSVPFLEDDLCQNIVSPYGASKKSAEFFVESFNKNFGLKSIILRFFTVYGPRGRVDMAPALFAKAIERKKPIMRFGDGSTGRDYTFINDIIEGVVKALEKNFEFEVVNLGNNKSVQLRDFIKTIENILGKKATIKELPERQGDAIITRANIEKAKKVIGWQPKIDLEEGLTRYIRWLQEN